MTANLVPISKLPGWVPSAVRLYLNHTESGQSLREIARAEGVHSSTVLRQVRRFENRRDDPLVDCALGRLKDSVPAASGSEESRHMTYQARPPKNGVPATLTDSEVALNEQQLEREALRVLRRLAEPGAMLAVAPDMERAVVLRDGEEGAIRLAVLDRPVAEAFALRDWITCKTPGRVSRYEITNAGRTTLRRLAAGEGLDADADGARQRNFDPEDTRRTRPVSQETPVAALARRRDRDGNPFLTNDLVTVAERLREDFETAQTGPRVAQDWDRFLEGGARRGGGSRDPMSGGASAARDRVANALQELGPGLADMVLRCCCYLEGLETAERQLGWSARSGKIVLRIALLRLKRHYDELGEAGKMIG